jgi:hypothetical protein
MSLAVVAAAEGDSSLYAIPALYYYKDNVAASALQTVPCECLHNCSCRLNFRYSMQTSTNIAPVPQHGCMRETAVDLSMSQDSLSVAGVAAKLSAHFLSI